MPGLRFFHRLVTLAVVLAAVASAVAETKADAVLVEMADVHSAYDRLPQLLAQVDAVFAEHPASSRAVLIDGDLFEGANVVGRRSEGGIELAFLRELVRRAPTFLNLGNHEPEFYDMAETVRRIRATGAIVIGATIRDRVSGRLFAEASVRLKLGGRDAVIVGLATDRLTTFRDHVRASLQLDDPEGWARQNLRSVLLPAAVRIVLSHCGLVTDRRIFPQIPDGTLFVGAHDHLELIHSIDRTVYFHAGSWGSDLAVITASFTPEVEWHVELRPVSADGQADEPMAELVRSTLARYLTSEETTVIGDSPSSMSPAAAARFATESVRRATGADVAVIGGTTFGAGLPAGSVTRYAFDAWVRFDGPLFEGEIQGSRLRELAARSNQGPNTPFDLRAGENLVMAGPESIDDTRVYRLVTTDWIAAKPAFFLGPDAPLLRPAGGRTLKAAIRQGLAEQRTSGTAVR